MDRTITKRISGRLPSCINCATKPQSKGLRLLKRLCESTRLTEFWRILRPVRWKICSLNTEASSLTELSAWLRVTINSEKCLGRCGKTRSLMRFGLECNGSQDPRSNSVDWSSVRFMVIRGGDQAHLNVRSSDETYTRMPAET